MFKFYIITLYNFFNSFKEINNIKEDTQKIKYSYPFY